MFRTRFLSLFSLAIIGCACAQTTPDTSNNLTTGSDEGTVACKTEAAMVTLMEATPPSQITNQEVLQRLTKSGDCLIMPKGWAVLTMDDPPLDKQKNHASKWTIRTPHGIVHMWGTPFGGD